MTKTPSISVIMPVFNSENTVHAAIESILNQTFREFEFIMIDDGSTDDSYAIMQQYQQIDNRVRVIQQQNQGITVALNAAINHAQGEYIARMDADDIAYPQRLEAQHQLMSQYLSIGICGTQIEIFGAKTGIGHVPTDPTIAKFTLLFRTPVYHPTVMIRRSLLEKHQLRYDPENTYIAAEDYDLWLRASKYTEIANHPDTLLRYRISDTQITHRLSDAQKASTYHIYRRLLAPLGIIPKTQELAVHLAVGWRSLKANGIPIADAEIWLKKILQANNQQQVYAPDAFAKFIGDLFYINCRNYGGEFATWWLFVKSPLSQFVPKAKWIKLLGHVLR